MFVSRTMRMVLTYSKSILMCPYSLLSSKHVLHNFIRISFWVCGLHFANQIEKSISGRIILIAFTDSKDRNSE